MNVMSIYFKMQELGVSVNRRLQIGSYMLLARMIVLNVYGVAAWYSIGYGWHKDTTAFWGPLSECLRGMGELAPVASLSHGQYSWNRSNGTKRAS